jgi:hypothetical protein
LGSIYITTLIFTQNIIVSVKIELSLRLNGDPNWLEQTFFTNCFLLLIFLPLSILKDTF